MSGRKPGQHADLWMVFGSTGDCHMKYLRSPGSDTDIWYRKLASKRPVSTRLGGTRNLATEDGKHGGNEHSHCHRISSHP